MSNRPELAGNRLLTRALRLGWQIPEEAKKLALEQAMDILKTSPSTKARINASRLIVAMEQSEAVAINTAIAAQAAPLERTLLRCRIDQLSRDATGDDDIIDAIRAEEEQRNQLCGDNMNGGDKWPERAAEPNQSAIAESSTYPTTPTSLESTSSPEPLPRRRAGR